MFFSQEKSETGETEIKRKKNMYTQNGKTKYSFKNVASN